ncbi:hypothetical protein [Bacillus gaemokensis]|uniref:Uncharacterized protein n=1 Tax=Bacillus gaemokensis TaxID=574375 RepID=A0A073KIF0_9BACI|nr:hypothetical protein [Bacillus gaemokensis]KEK22108.1 hypothetical protein BAGA_22045 [Bacillus gaemokensis]KYG35531.1 hypothetical protein AZF08_26695 [Bacillus gaemokensis]
MKRYFSLLIVSIIIIFTVFVPSTNAATLISVTSKHSDNSTKSLDLIGTGKYMKMTCTYYGKTTAMASDASCSLYKKSSPTTIELVADLHVGGCYGSITESTDVWLEKGASYILQADVSTFADPKSSVTTTIIEI